MKRTILTLLIFSSFTLGCQKNDRIIENENLNKEENTSKNVTTTTITTTTTIEKNNQYFVEIDAMEFKNRVNSSNSYIFFIGRDTCPACQKFKPIAKEFSSKEKVTIYYVNTTSFDNSDWNIIDEIVDVTYIPTIIISKNSNILYSEYGVHQYSELENLVNDYNLK